MDKSICENMSLRTWWGNDFVDLVVLPWPRKVLLDTGEAQDKIVIVAC